MNPDDPATNRISREAHEYGYTKARMLRDLGYEPRLAQEARWHLHEEFYARYEGDDLDVAADVYWPNFADGFLAEAELDGPPDPAQRSRALYALSAGVADPANDPLSHEREVLLEGPHAAWAARELDAFDRAGRKVGDPPTDLPEPHLIQISVRRTG